MFHGFQQTVCSIKWAAHGLSTGDPEPGSGRRGSTVAGGDSRWDDGYTKWFFFVFSVGQWEIHGKSMEKR